MKRLGPCNTMVLALLIGLGLLIVTADQRALASVDLRRPTTLLSFLAKRLHVVHTSVLDGVRNQIDAFTPGFRETVRKHEGPKKALER